jgi:hypothetical protein
MKSGLQEKKEFSLTAIGMVFDGAKLEIEKALNFWKLKAIDSIRSSWEFGRTRLPQVD